MRLVEYYLQTELFEDDLYKDTMNIIKEECSDIIDLYKKTNSFIYRGLKRTDNKKAIVRNVYKITPRTDRSPKDTSWDDQEIIDGYFYKKFGWKPRSEGVFTSQTYSVAGSYGDVGIFLPVNGYKYLWSKKYGDLYSDFFEDLVREYDPLDFEGKWVDEHGEEYDGYYDVEGYLNHTFKGNDTIQVTVKGDDYPKKVKKVILKYNPSVTMDNFEKELEKKYKHAVNEYQDNDLNAFMKNRPSEAMFKCKYYYWIKWKGFNPADIGINKNEIK